MTLASNYRKRPMNFTDLLKYKLLRGLTLMWYLLLDVSETFLKVVVNWLLLLSCVFWLPVFFICATVIRAWQSPESAENEAMTGKIWFFQMFNIY